MRESLLSIMKEGNHIFYTRQITERKTAEKCDANAVISTINITLIIIFKIITDIICLKSNILQFNIHLFSRIKSHLFFNEFGSACFTLRIN